MNYESETRGAKWETYWTCVMVDETNDAGNCMVCEWGEGEAINVLITNNTLNFGHDRSQRRM